MDLTSLINPITRKEISPAQNGVRLHANIISRITLFCIDFIPRTNPTPKTAPTIECDVETGIPNIVYKLTFNPEAISATIAIIGIRWVILKPTVSITRRPQVTTPMVIANAPNTVAQKGEIIPVPEITPVTLATSFAPQVKARYILVAKIRNLIAASLMLAGTRE